MSMSHKAIALALALPVLGHAQAPAGPLPRDELQALASAYHVLLQSYNQPVSGEDIMRAALRGMLRELDPENGRYLSKEDLDELALRRSYRGGAIGLEMTRRDGEVTVVTPLPDSPAEQAGLRPNDRVYAIDGTPLRGDVDLAHKALRGAVGSTAVLRVGRASEEPRELRIERQTVPAASVRLSLPTPGIAVLRMSSFGHGTLDQLASALALQWRQAPFKGIVVDLRRNPGGLLDTAIGVAALFLPPTAVVAGTLARERDANVVYKAHPLYYSRTGTDPYTSVPAEVRRLPVVVLVDEGTASGAEIVAAALRDHQRARIVGRQTFGRTSIQQIRPLNAGHAIQFTLSNWFPPSKENLDKVGLTPHRIVDKADPRLELDEAIAELQAQIR